MTEDGNAKSSWTRPFMMVVIGGTLAFLGFVCPGLLWCLNTPGDTEMITLITAGVIGALGSVIFLFGVATSISFILESRQQAK